MENVVLVLHLILAVSIIGLVLLQRSEGGGLGIGGGGGGLGGLATPQGAANVLTKMTAFCAAGFFCTSILLSIMAGGHNRDSRNIIDSLGADAPAAIEVPIDAPETPPATPEVPIQ
jgi:preprotein translocase subunit SecG